MAPPWRIWPIINGVTPVPDERVPTTGNPVVPVGSTQPAPPSTPAQLWRMTFTRDCKPIALWNSVIECNWNVYERERFAFEAPPVTTDSCQPPGLHSGNTKTTNNPLRQCSPYNFPCTLAQPSKLLIWFVMARNSFNYVPWIIQSTERIVVLLSSRTPLAISFIILPQ